MINGNNAIVKFIVLGYSNDFSETYTKNVTQNGEAWYMTTVTQADGMSFFRSPSPNEPYVARKNPAAKWVFNEVIRK